MRGIFGGHPSITGEPSMHPQALAQCQAIATEVLSNVTADQMELATPCAEWNVGQLIDHLVGSQNWGAAAMQGVAPEAADGASEGDYMATFQQAAEVCLAEFSQEGALEKMVNPGFGDMPGAAMMGLMMTDTFQHAWDLATATGQDNNLNPELAGQLLQASQQMIQPAFRSEEGTIFGMEQQAAEGTNMATQLAAFLGRSV